MSLRLKFGLVVTFIMLLNLAGFSVLLSSELSTLGDQLSFHIYGQKLKGDLWTLEQAIAREYGTLSLKDGILVDAAGKSLSGRFELVDDLAKNLGVKVTIFSAEGDDFRRTLTTLNDDQGHRAVGTMLGTSSAAYPSVRAGNTYQGRATILGHRHVTVYEPLKDGQGAVVGILFLGISEGDVQNQVSMLSGGLLATLVAISLLLTLILTAGTILVFNRMLLVPLKRVSRSLEVLAKGEGDLSHRLPLMGRDEVGLLSREFNRFLDQMASLVGSLQAVSVQSRSIGADLAATAAQTSAMAVQFQGNTAQITDGTSKLLGAVQTVTSASQDVVAQNAQVEDLLSRQSGEVEESSRTFSLMGVSLRKIEEEVDAKRMLAGNLAEEARAGGQRMVRLAKAVQAFHESAQVIEEMRQVIDDVADRTNLLAMNASIEAAHAGVSGRGFAVVADEIRKLAEATRTNAARIGESLQAALDQTSTADALGQETSSAISRVVVGIEDVAQGLVQTKAALEALSEGSRKLETQFGTLLEVNRLVINGSRAGSASLASTSGSLGEIASGAQENLQGLVEIDQGMAELARSAENLARLGESNARNSEQLDLEIGRYKV